MDAESKTTIGFVAAASIALMTILVISCGDDPVQPGADPIPDLAGTAWKLTTVESISDTLFDSYENGTWQVPDEEQYLIEFTADSSLFAFLYCEECPDSEESRFEVAGEDSVSINLNCESRSVCQKNIPVRERLESVVTVEQENETLIAEYVFTGDESEEFRGRMHFSRAHNVRPESVPFEVLRGQWPVWNCGFNAGNLELDDDNENLSQLELIITTQEEFDHYITCNEETEVDMEEYFVLAGYSRMHHSCVYISGHTVYLLNDILYYSVK